MKFWPNKKEKEYPKEGDFYEFIDLNNDESVTAIKVIKSKFEGVVYYYGKVGVVNENPPRIEFEYFLEESGNFSFDDLQFNKEFDTLMGDILVSIFDANILKKEKEIDESSRIIDIKKSDL